MALSVVSIVHCQAREQIDTIESVQGQDLAEFLTVVGSKLRTYTDRTGHEACAAIGIRDNGSYSVQVFTDGVSIGCTIDTGEIQQGARFTGEIIHSHPTQKILSIGAAERAWAERHKAPSAGAATVRNDGSSGFSRVDYNYSGVSWLVAGRTLLRKDERGKTRKVGEIPR
ncbi:hypothetical protein [Stenotrophomonas sp. SG1]|uniref:hypothetical protein n=1 Tax=Stenotrophomonas sp. SG1 TaxID=2944932 RepID=UPI00224307BF|nr:hypothetical protein [Stenotrophomonas sp. SG1]